MDKQDLNANVRFIQKYIIIETDFNKKMSFAKGLNHSYL